MIIPTLNCPSNCKYCWGSENKKEMMVENKDDTKMRDKERKKGEQS